MAEGALEWRKCMNGGTMIIELGRDGLQVPRHWISPSQLLGLVTREEKDEKGFKYGFRGWGH